MRCYRFAVTLSLASSLPLGSPQLADSLVQFASASFSQLLAAQLPVLLLAGAHDKISGHSLAATGSSLAYTGSFLMQQVTLQAVVCRSLVEQTADRGYQALPAYLFLVLDTGDREGTRDGEGEGRRDGGTCEEGR